MRKFLALPALLAAVALPAKAALLITEVDPTGSSTAAYGADWFELTNTGAASLDITGWKVDDDSATFANALALRGITSIGAGESVVFIESNTSGSNDAAIQASFEAAWFGDNVPEDFKIGSYGGSGIGLGSSGDAVNIYDSAGALVASVTFGAATTGKTFDNAAGLNGAAISQLSAIDVNGAFASVSSGEIGSPGTIVATAVPEPSTWAVGVALLGFGAVVARRRRQA